MNNIIKLNPNNKKRKTKFGMKEQFKKLIKFSNLKHKFNRIFLNNLKKMGQMILLAPFFLYFFFNFFKKDGPGKHYKFVHSYRKKTLRNFV
jgi:hypothetical protein